MAYEITDAKLGTQNLLGLADEPSEDLRARLALATQYLANWYKATKDAETKDVWWQRIDGVRSEIETVYKQLLQEENKYFPGNVEKAAYEQASAHYAQLYTDLELSPDLIDVSLLDSVGGFFETLIQSPSTIVGGIAEELGKTVNDAFGRFLARAWPVVIAAAVVGTVYVFREPLAKLASKAVR